MGEEGKEEVGSAMGTFFCVSDRILKFEIKVAGNHQNLKKKKKNSKALAKSNKIKVLTLHSSKSPLSTGS